jgi:hypothetical protein
VNLPNMLTTLLDEGYEVRFASDPAGRGCYAGLTGPLGSQAAGTGETPAAALASVWPLDGSAPYQAADVAEPVDPTAAAILAARSPHCASTPAVCSPARTRTRPARSTACPPTSAASR